VHRCVRPVLTCPLRPVRVGSLKAWANPVPVGSKAMIKLADIERGPKHPEESVDPRWSTLVLVCSACDGARKGPGSVEIRKHLKKHVDRGKTLRVVEVDCLKDCPDHAVATCTIETQGAPVRIRRIASDGDLAALTAELAEPEP
jgi:hypothetical protein